MSRYCYTRDAQFAAPLTRHKTTSHGHWERMVIIHSASGEYHNDSCSSPSARIGLLNPEELCTGVETTKDA